MGLMLTVNKQLPQMLGVVQGGQELNGHVSIPTHTRSQGIKTVLVFHSDHTNTAWWPVHPRTVLHSLGSERPAVQRAECAPKGIPFVGDAV
jgi:hypothetical protein